MIKAAKFARENSVPLLGICLGMQVIVIEFARNVCKLSGANSKEMDPSTYHPVIDIMKEQKNLSGMGGSMRLGAYPCDLLENSLAARAYGKLHISERHRHRYEFNNAYKERLENAGLVLSGICTERNLIEIVELKNHAWYLGAQFHAELKSRPVRPHPLFNGFINAAANFMRNKNI